MQNDFVRVGAPLEVPEARPTIPVHQSPARRLPGARDPDHLHEVAGGAGVDAHVAVVAAGGAAGLLLLEGFLRHYEDVGKELDCSDIIDELYPEPGDPIVDKFGYGAFHNTNLDDLLKARHVESVLITGTVTQICVEETARESMKRGYSTTLISDAVSTYAPDLQVAVFKNFAHKFGWVSTAAEIIAALPPKR